MQNDIDIDTTIDITSIEQSFTTSLWTGMSEGQLIEFRTNQRSRPVVNYTNKGYSSNNESNSKIRRRGTGGKKKRTHKRRNK